MHRKVVKRDSVEWERASCKGLETDFFYLARTDLLTEGLTYNQLRTICFSCPIQNQCLEVGTAFEPYGFWGGLSEDERRHIYAGNFDTRIITWLRRDLKQLGIGISSLVKVVLSVERDFTFNK
jgi:WhiB family redox-sensing transcriptional regulator